MMIHPYAYMGLFVVVSLFILLSVYTISWFLRGRLSPHKDEAYACGLESMHLDNGQHVNIHFYVPAIFSVLLMPVLIFLLPWALSLDLTGIFGLFSVIIFILFWVAAIVYKWKKGFFEWV